MCRMQDICFCMLKIPVRLGGRPKQGFRFIKLLRTNIVVAAVASECGGSLLFGLPESARRLLSGRRVPRDQWRP